MDNTARKHRINLEIVQDETPKCVAIDPCELCYHKDYVNVDKRCQACGLRGRRFFEVLHISKTA